MTATLPSHVRDDLDALQDAHGPAPVEHEDPPFEAPPELFERLAAGVDDGTVHGSYVWVRRREGDFPPRSPAQPTSSTPDRERVLLVYDRADDHEWTAPGGSLEPGESFATAARRELAEETGIEADLVGLRKVQHKVAVPAEPVDGVDAAEVHALYPLFDAEYAAGTLDVQDAELYGAAWFDRLPDDAHELVADQTIGGP